ncbi:MAG: ABC transporter ATP-binding protein [Bacillati bacterium ANGP1]|uniref:ABC transporter ATP-binding protein n=1 Tax=Candidatus Segetimicrobium genomatis TaxID=2569760 RepID=A0A537JZG0_9BACT|nr:MAG: ABC transporter ATP-binding protein [Terrabacteria group bacterium ANGP1]
MGAAVLEVRELRAGYGSGDILQGVTLRLAAGEIVATIGRNGVGKSTLMRAIIGLLPVGWGSILFQGMQVAPLTADRRAALGIGYVPQGREIFPEMTVEENLMLGETINREKTRPLYDLVYEYFPVLRERRRQLAGTFSGGQQQMLAIGRALVGDPSLLLLDEASMGIQPNIVDEIARILVRLNREERLTILLVEQNMRLISSVAHRAYAMDKGRIVATLTREELTDRDHLVRYLAI